MGWDYLAGVRPKDFLGVVRLKNQCLNSRKDPCNFINALL